MTKLRRYTLPKIPAPTLLTERYKLEEHPEEDILGKQITIWLLKDMTKGRHGRVVGKFWEKPVADLCMDYINYKKKIRRRRAK